MSSSNDPVWFVRLECDQECAALERNKRLAEALQIDPSADPFNVRSTSVYSDSLKEDARSESVCDPVCVIAGCWCVAVQIGLKTTSSFRKDLKFVTEVEEEIKNLVELANKVGSYRLSPSLLQHPTYLYQSCTINHIKIVSYRCVVCLCRVSIKDTSFFKSNDLVSVIIVHWQCTTPPKLLWTNLTLVFTVFESKSPVCKGHQ